MSKCASCVLATRIPRLTVKNIIDLMIPELSDIIQNLKNASLKHTTHPFNADFRGVRKQIIAMVLAMSHTAESPVLRPAKI